MPIHLEVGADRGSPLAVILRGLDALVERSTAAFGLLRTPAPLAASG